MYSAFRWSGTTFNLGFSWGPPFGFLTEFLVNFELKIQRGDPMKIWNWKLSQINETRCASTYGQMDITHQVSSKSHNVFLKNSISIQAGIILNNLLLLTLAYLKNKFFKKILKSISNTKNKFHEDFYSNVFGVGFEI